LATAILAGHFDRAGAIERCAFVLGRRRVWLNGLAARIFARFREGGRPRTRSVAEFILHDPGFGRACEKQPIAAESIIVAKPAMRPADGPAATWAIPPILSPGDLGRRLNLSPNELAWFAECRSLERRLPVGPLRHYHYRWQPKRDGTARLIESPKQRLKAIQRHLLAEILDLIPPHPAAHGFRRGRSIKTFVQAHIGRAMVLKVDLKDFFPSVRPARVVGVFLAAGYPENVAVLLAGLCLNSTPPSFLDAYPSAFGTVKPSGLKDLYGRPHLPQGAPTSPALANLGAYRLDCRLAGLARSAGADYTRYADDLVFSGGPDFARMANRFYARVCVIALDEGFEVNTRKTRMMRRSVSQRAAGVVINDRANIPRPEFDRLKAILHNCAVEGPASQNRDGQADFAASLLGRVAHVEMLNPARGKKLKTLFDKIKW
jgi:hypothetical protein